MSFKMCSFKIKISAENFANFPSSIAGVSPETNHDRLQDIRLKFNTYFRNAIELGESDRDSSASRKNEREQYMVSYKVELPGISTKPLAFKHIRQEWRGKICNPGDPFWLESSEIYSSTFPYRVKTPKHRLQASSLSLGSFYAKSTFIEHYNTNYDRNYIEKEDILSIFEHDTERLTLTVALKSRCPADGTKFRLEFDYKQFEEYVLVDENKALKFIDLYIPMIRPPVVKKEVKGNFVRCVKFLSCSREILGNSSVLRLRYAHLDQEDRGAIELITRLGSQGHRTIYFAAVLTKPPRNPTEVPAKPDLGDFKARYALECLLSRGFKVSDRVTDAFYKILRDSLESHEIAQICRALYQLIAYADNDRFCPLEAKLQQLLFGTFKKNVDIEFEIPKHYAHVPRIIVTPTQDYLVQPELVAENRVIRQYGHEFAMRIAFRDEDFNKLMSFGDSLDDVLKVRVVDLLKNGFELCGRRFQFLACSNSQLRDHGAWLFAKHDEVGPEEIRESLGQLDNIRCVATYVSRMGQCFSSTKESVKVSIPAGVLIKKIEDIELKYRNVKFECCGEIRSGKYTFSDGIGKISLSLAKKVAESLGLKSIPSAYQIRYGGCKGMLAIDTKIPGSTWKDVVCYRKSMEKFHSGHKDLEICEYSKPNLLYLNRQCITLLSGLGVKDEAFIKLQDAMLMRLASMLLSEKVALDMIGRASIAGGMKTSFLRDSGIAVTHEPFFRSMLLAIYKTRLNDLIRKARIAIPQAFGRLMVGVLDETGKLEYGQVFIRYTKNIGGSNEEFVTRKGPVMVTKNPCFHPGDMRKLDAVDIQGLHHLVDCIVFPAKGPRPHTDEISGSDLDGDKYFVTWYDPFLTPKKNSKPMDFASPEKKELDRSVGVNDMIDFIAEYIKNDQLGIIANAHLVHADSEEKGVKSDKCVKLAHMHSDAVDFPKTGKCPSLTADLRPEQYPDFMMKVDKPRYRSTHVLGKLFQKCRQLERARHFISQESTLPDFKVDQDLIVEGHRKYIESAIEKRDYYNTKLGSLMALYGLKNEGEVITGCLMKVSSRLSGKTDERFEVAQLIQASVASLRSNLKEEFYKEFGGKDKVDEMYESKKRYPKNVLLKASAWYAVTYTKMATREEVPGSRETANQSRDEWSLSDTPLLSFPWVVARLLAYIKKNVLKKRGRDANEIHELRDISEVVTTQAERLFGSARKDMLDDLEIRQAERDRIYELLCARSGKQLPPIPLLSESMTGLNIGDKQLQPLQLYIHVGWKSKEKRQTQYLESLQVHSLLNGNISPIKEKGLKISLTANSYKMRKSMYVFLHIKKCPRLLHLLLVIMHLGHKRHLTGCGSDSFISAEDLAVLFIRFCESTKRIEKITLADLLNQAKEILSEGKPKAAEEEWKKTILEAKSHSKNGFLNNIEPGLALIEFLEYYVTDSELDTLHISKLKSVKNPVNSEEYLLPDLSPKQIQRFSDAALHAFHEIAQCRGLDSILKSTDHENRDVPETLTLPKCTWGTIRGAEDFVAFGLSELTGAKVNIRQAERGGKFIMEVLGNYSTLSQCQEERKSLEKRLKGVVVYDNAITSGCRFIFLDQKSDEDPVTAKELPGTLHRRSKFAVHLKNKPSQSGVDEKKLLNALGQQLGVFNRNYISYLHGSKKLEMTLVFGSVYVTDAHAWVQSGSTVKDVETTLYESAASDTKSYKGKGNPTSSNVAKKAIFTDLRCNIISLKDLRQKMSALFGTISHVRTNESYLVDIEDKSVGAHLTVVYDKDLGFKHYLFKPFKWLVADLKTHRPPGTTSRDIDLRFTMTSTRELETQEAQELPIYETFGKTEILAPVNDRLKISAGYRKYVTSVRLVVVDVLIFEHQGIEIFLEERRIKQFDVKRSYVLGKPLSEFSTVNLCGFFDGNDGDKARKLAKALLSAGKIMRPLVLDNC